MSRVSVTPAKEKAVCTHLTRHPKSGIYRIRRRVPKDLLGQYSPRTEFNESLRTTDRQEAEKRCRIRSVALDQEFDRARSRAKKSTAQGNAPEVPAPEAAPVLITSDELNVHEREELDILESTPAVHDLPDEAVRVMTEQTEIAHDSWQRLQRGDPPRPSSEATRFLREDSRPAVLADIAKKWANERKPIQRTIGQVNKVVRRFVQHIGELPVDQITRRRIVEFKDKLLASGQTATNTNKQLTLISTLLNFAVNNSVIDTNPAKGINAAQSKHAKEARLPFDLPALNAIFSSPIYTKGDRPAGGKGEAAYWLPLLALFTGARIEELCQLHPSDVYEETYHDTDATVRTAYILRITDTGPNQSLKNAGSRRRFPIHPELIRLGFIEYAKQAHGRDRIFDKLHKDTVGDESGNWSKWFGGYLRSTIGVQDNRMVFHSFRHTFKDIARAMGIPEDVSDAITGHSNGKVSRRYGGLNYPLSPLVNAINGFKVHGLELIG